MLGLCRWSIAILFAVALTTGCTKSSTEEKSSSVQTIELGQILSASNLTLASKAEQLAKAAEQLLTVQGFVYANDVADLALAQDASNLRARFIKAILVPVMVQKGIFARLAPLAAKDARAQEEYSNGLAELQSKYPNSTLKTFLLDGVADIRDESDVQNYVESLVEGFAAIRKFSKDNKDQNLTVLASDTFLTIMKRRYEESCIVVRVDPWTYRIECPSPVNLMEITLSRADFEGLQQIAAGYELYFALYNSYDVNGAGSSS